MVQIGEFQRVAQEEHRRIVSNKVPVALLCIEFNGKAADVALGIGRATLSCHGRETYEQLCLFSDFREDGSLRVLRNVVSHRKFSKRAGTFGVHAAFRYHLTVEMCQFFQKPNILQ